MYATLVPLADGGYGCGCGGVYWMATGVGGAYCDSCGLFVAPADLGKVYDDDDDDDV